MVIGACVIQVLDKVYFLSFTSFDFTVLNTTYLTQRIIDLNYPFYIRVAKLSPATKNGSMALSCNKETGMCVQSCIKECSSPDNCQNKCGKRIKDCIKGRCKCRKCVRSKECTGMCLQKKTRKIIVKEKCLCRKGICRRFKLKVFITLGIWLSNAKNYMLKYLCFLLIH